MADDTITLVKLGPMDTEYERRIDVPARLVERRQDHAELTAIHETRREMWVGANQALCRAGYVQFATAKALHQAPRETLRTIEALERSLRAARALVAQLDALAEKQDRDGEGADGS